MNGAPSGDDGMTLIEMLISIALLGLIIAPITLALFLALEVSASSSQRTTDSADAQISSSYFASDVQSADVVRQASYVCATSNALVELEWADAATGDRVAVAYAPSTSAGVDRLERVAYSISSSDACSETSRTTAVHNLNPAVPPTLACEPSGDCVRGSVVLQVSALSASVHGRLYEAYAFTLAGTRRAT